MPLAGLLTGLAFLLGPGCVSQTPPPDAGALENAAAAPATGVSAQPATAEEGKKTPAEAVSAAAVYFDAAERFRELHDKENALLNYRKALELAPDHYAAQVGLAETLAQVGNEKEAVELLKNLLRKLQDQPRSGDLARLQETAEGLLLGLDELGLALSDVANRLVEYGANAENAGRLENAVELYKWALTLWPACSEAQKRAYQICKRQGWRYPGELVTAVTRDTFLDLTELTPASVSVKEGQLLVNETRWGLPIYNKGTVFANGLWAPAPSKVSYNLKGNYKRFESTVLVAAFKGQEQQVKVLEEELAKPRKGTVRFRVMGDDKVLFESEIMTYGAGPRKVAVDVNGVQVLTLEADEADGSSLFDFAVWADGRLFLL